MLEVAWERRQTERPGEGERLGKGTVLWIGEAIVEITAVGKEDARKPTYSYEGYILLAEKGLFGRVLKSGRVRAGDAVYALNK
jgi:MOSC domain-containing protein YiiM